ncbi:unnamed protein product, partial [Hymenolepis diminuta]
CGVRNANKADCITCVRTFCEVRYVIGRVENKRGVPAETSSTNQQSRSLQLSMVLYLMTKLLTTTETRK